MKKLFYFCFLLPLAVLMSCNDDKDFSPVDMTLTLSGVTVSDGHFYTVGGEEVTIDKLEVKSVDGKNTALANVVFDLSGAPIYNYPESPNLGSIPTENLPIATYSLGITGNLLQVDQSIKIFAISYPLTIVGSVEDLPAGVPEIGTYSITYKITEAD